MTPKRQRLLFALFGLTFLIAAALIILNNFRENLVFFFSPTELMAKHPAADQLIRIGGLVENGSLQKDGTHLSFQVTDLKTRLAVSYEGLPPALFREGQGVVAEGYYRDGHFDAQTLLAKHDENYMPPEVAKALKESGHWEYGAKGKPPASAEQPAP